MGRAAVGARAEVERKVGEAAVARKRVREMLERNAASVAGAGSLKKMGMGEEMRRKKRAKSRGGEIEKWMNFHEMLPTKKGDEKEKLLSCQRGEDEEKCTRLVESSPQGSPAKISKVAVGKLLDGANTRRRLKECRLDECDAKNEKVPRENDKLNKEHIHDFSLKRCNNGNGEKNTSNREWSAHCDANDTQNMQARNQPKHKKEENPTCDFGPNSNSAPKTQHENGSLVEILKEAVRMLLDRSNSRKRRKECRPDEDAAKNKKLPRENDELYKKHIQDLSLKGCNIGNAERGTSKGERSVHCDSDEMDWEEGNISVPEFSEGCSHDGGKDVTVEFMDSPSSDKKKHPRRTSAEDKELAELVHKVHLLCLLARGRIVDNACNDPLIQVLPFIMS